MECRTHIKVHLRELRGLREPNVGRDSTSTASINLSHSKCHGVRPLNQLTERDKREYTSRSTAGSYADGGSLLSDEAARSTSTASTDLSHSNCHGVWPLDKLT